MHAIPRASLQPQYRSISLWLMWRCGNQDLLCNSTTAQLNEDALKRGEPEPLKIGEYALSAKNTITMYVA